MSLQLVGGALARANIPADDHLVAGAREEQLIEAVPGERSNCRRMSAQRGDRLVDIVLQLQHLNMSIGVANEDVTRLVIELQRRAAELAKIIAHPMAALAAMPLKELVAPNAQQPLAFERKQHRRDATLMGGVFAHLLDAIVIVGDAELGRLPIVHAHEETLRLVAVVHRRRRSCSNRNNQISPKK